MKLGQMVCYCAARTGLPGQLLGLTHSAAHGYRVAEVLVTAQDAWVLTDEIEAQRHAMKNFRRTAARKPLADAVARAPSARGHRWTILSDRPTSHQDSLPPSPCITSE